MSVQNYETDVLQEHTDSTPILIARLDQWRHSVHVVQQYIQGYYQVHQSISGNLEKSLKSINDVPTFSGHTQSGDAGAGDTQLANVFRNLQSNVNVLLQRSIATTNGIKSSVLPSLDEVAAEIERHYKTLRTQGSKGIKEVEKCREHTQKLVEHLGQVTSSFGTRALSPSEDPLIIHRKVEAAVVDQVGRENTQAEAALSVQQSFASLEGHVIQTIRNALTGLATLNEGFDKSEFEINKEISDMFKRIDMNKEWQIFTKSNAESLVPSTNFKRDPSKVTFVNKSHQSTKPILQGLLSRKGTVLKSYNQGYYVISPTGYLYQFKGADPSQETTPELSLYLPDCQVSKSSKVGEFVFKVVGKDSHKAISTRHKFVFRTGSQRELDTWYSAVARMTGNEAGVDDDSDDTPAQSPVEPPVTQMNNASIDERTASASPVAAPAATPTAAPAATPAAAPAHVTTATSPSAATPAATSTYAATPAPQVNQTGVYGANVGTSAAAPSQYQATGAPQHSSQLYNIASSNAGLDTPTASAVPQQHIQQAQSAASQYIPHQDAAPGYAENTEIPSATNIKNDVSSTTSNDPFKGF